MNKVLSNLISLDNIKQWENEDSVIKESVSQHCFKVAAICSYILSKVNCSNEYKSLCVQYSVWHDFDESVIGRDIPHPTKYNKYNGEEIRHAINVFVEHELKHLELDEFFSQFDSDVKTFVKLCDWITLYIFILRNERVGSHYFDSEKVYCWDNILKKCEDVKSLFKVKFNTNFDVKIIEDLLTK